MAGTAFVGGHVVPVEGEPFDGTVVVTDGRVAALGPDVEVPEDAEVVDVSGRWLLPGFLDAHAHVGLWEEGEGWAGQDTNEMTEPVTAQVRAVDAVNPRDLGFQDAIAGGVLAMNVMPGSGNAIGGQAAVLKAWGRTVDEMVLRAPSGMKSALGENPKRVHGDAKRMPSTRLGTAAVIRDAFARAADYRERWRAQEPGKPAPDRDLKLEALGLVLDGTIPWRQHCHRADDIATALRLADEFGYRLVIDHGTEAVEIADVLAERGVPVVIGPLFTTRSKVELRHRSLANPGRLHDAGVTLCITTDHPVVPINFLVHQATLAVKEGLDRTAALHALTVNPARVLGVADRLGSLAVGKDADLCVWSGDPLDVMSRVQAAYVDGRQVYRYDDAARAGVHVAPSGRS